MSGIDLTAYRAEVAALGFDTTTTGLDAAINAARRELCSARSWSWMEVNASTLPCVIGQGSYNLSALTGTGVVAAAGEARTVSAVRLKRGSDTWELVPLDREQFREREHDNLDNDLPQYWTASGVDLSSANEQLNLLITPKPNAVYTLVVDWEIGVNDLVLPADVDAVIPKRLKHIIAYGAGRRLALRQRDPNLLSMLESEYATLLRDERRVDRQRQRQSTEQVRTSGVWDVYGGFC